MSTTKIIPSHAVVRKQPPATAIKWDPKVGHHWVRQPPGFTDPESLEYILPTRGYVTERKHGGDELLVEEGDWIVEEDGKRMVMSEETFWGTFELIMSGKDVPG